MENYKIIFLILDSDGDEIYNYNRFIWKQYMNSSKDIKCFFVKYKKDIENEIEYNEEENRIYVKGEEEYSCEKILGKTIKGAKFIHENYKYDFLIRTNLSTFWVFRSILRFVKKDFGSKYIIGWTVRNSNDCPNTTFISGTGIIIPSDLVPILFTLKKTKYIMDDIEISELYRENNVAIKSARDYLKTYIHKFEFNNKNSIDKFYDAVIEGFCVKFRVKSKRDRFQNDKYVLDKLLYKYYHIGNSKEYFLKYKLHNLLSKNTIKYFKSNKVIDWSNYFADELINVFKGKNMKQVRDYNSADLIITHIKQKKIDYYKENAINVIISGEPIQSRREYDISISTLKIFKNSIYNIYLPFLYQSLKEHHLSVEPVINFNEKKRFCAFMYFVDYPHRIHYFKLFSKYRRVDSLGKSCKNMEIKTKRINNMNITYLDEAVEIYKKYKFVISIENKLDYGYNTEKLINPIIAGSIPIYWGDPEIFYYINKKRVIYALDFKSYEALLKKIIEIDNDDELYQEIINEDVYIKTPEEIFSNYKKELVNIFK